jgi:hypothetical protein
MGILRDWFPSEVRPSRPFEAPGEVPAMSHFSPRSAPDAVERGKRARGGLAVVDAGALLLQHTLPRAAAALSK